jgi:hypothetical protein
METTFQSAAESAQCSSTAHNSGSRDGSITVSQLVDKFMAAYTSRPESDRGRDKSLAQRLQWWQAKIGHLTLAQVNDDDIFHAIEDLAAKRGRRYAAC